MMADPNMRYSYTYCMNQLGTAWRCNRQIPTTEYYCKECRAARESLKTNPGIPAKRDGKKGSSFLSRQKEPVSREPVPDGKFRERESAGLADFLGIEIAEALIEEAHVGLCVVGKHE
jgi:hypothetical protein